MYILKLIKASMENNFIFEELKSLFKTCRNISIEKNRPTLPDGIVNNLKGFIHNLSYCSQFYTK